jgi:hypothetical protein
MTLRRALRVRLAFRPTLAAVYLFTSTLAPALTVQAKDRRQEYGGSKEDGAYFNPQKVRERVEKVDRMVATQNRRLARLQGLPAAENVLPMTGAMNASLEKFMAADEMSEELEQKRAEASRTLAAAAGFQFRSFPDGRREWYKGGRTHRVENEKVVDAAGNVSRRDVTDMAYDNAGRLTASKTEVRDADGKTTTTQWNGTYEKDRLASFVETSWDALGNATRTERSDIAYGGAKGDQPVSYTDKITGPNGDVTRRQMLTARYDDQGRTSYTKEKITDPHGRSSETSWTAEAFAENPAYDAKNPHKGPKYLVSRYKEETVDDMGVRTRKDWKDARYDAQGQLASYTEENRDLLPDGSWRTRKKEWNGAEYEKGRLVRYRQKDTDEHGRVSRTDWRNGRYDGQGRALSYTEVVTDFEGKTSTRAWGGAEYNVKNELLSYRDVLTDAAGVRTEKTWTGHGYDKGQVTSYTEKVVLAPGVENTVHWQGAYEKNRLASFSETTVDPDGNRSVLKQTGLHYDAYGRMDAFDESEEDAFGNATGRAWRAKSINAAGNVLSYEETRTNAKGETFVSHWKDARYEKGRVTGYTEEITGEDGVLQNTVFEATKLDGAGNIVTTKETVRRADGTSFVRQCANERDAQGRLTESVSTETEADGRTWTLRTETLLRDSHGRAVSTRETTTAPDGQTTTRLASMTFGPKGLVSKSREKVTDPAGLTVTTDLDDIRYNGQGRATDSVKAVSRSDFPDVLSTTRLAGREYDANGEPKGGTETTETRGFVSLSGGERREVNLLVETGFEGVSLTGKGLLETYTQVTRSRGIDENGQKVDAEEKATTTGISTRGKTTTVVKAAWEAGRIVSRKTTVTTLKILVRDLQGRPLSSVQETRDPAYPGAVSTLARSGVIYGSGGEAVAYQETATDAQGKKTSRTVFNEVSDAAGRTLTRQEDVTEPGEPVAHVFWKAQGYNLSGQLSGYVQKTLKTYASGAQESIEQRVGHITYDAAGRVKGDLSVTEKSFTETEKTEKSVDTVLRQDIAYYTEADEKADRTHRQGEMAGFVRTLVSDDADEDGTRIVVTGLGYDDMGRPVDDGISLTADNDKLKDGLRLIGKILEDDSGGDNLLLALGQAIAWTQGLAGELAGWLRENIPASGAELAAGLWKAFGELGQAIKQGLSPSAFKAKIAALLPKELLAKIIGEKAGGKEAAQVLPALLVDEDGKPLAPFAPVSSLSAALGSFDHTVTVGGRAGIKFDALSRATSWREISTSSAAPDKHVVTEVSLEYQGDTQQLATYAARAQEGEKVTNLFRTGYHYDERGRAQTYMEASFEGDVLKISDAGRAASQDQVAGFMFSAAGEIAWRSLSRADKTALLQDILAGRKEVQGLVTFDQVFCRYDARGGLEAMFRRTDKRGYGLSKIGDPEALPDTLTDELGRARPRPKRRWTASAGPTTRPSPPRKRPSMNTPRTCRGRGPNTTRRPTSSVKPNPYGTAIRHSWTTPK